MQRIRLGRISAVVTALTLIGALHHSEAIAAMVAADEDGPFATSHVRVDLREIGVLAMLQVPYMHDGAAPLFGPLRCSHDARTLQNVCASKQPSDSSFSVRSITTLDRFGKVQPAFDRNTSTALIEHSAVVKSYTDARGHPIEMSFRSTRHFRGLDQPSENVVLRGADTSYNTVRRGTTTNRRQLIVHYSDVTLPRSIATSPTLGYPTSGVIYALGHHEWVTTKWTRPFKSNIVVYFDGSRTPDAYLDGRRHHLDLRTGIATPYGE
ncbi:MAG TPA: hypothetical protein VE861_15020 [Gemmatimonadaceae bacterium]|nr:hypothetical protein [Gemmatimonadaceae bacterium]